MSIIPLPRPPAPGPRLLSVQLHHPSPYWDLRRFARSLSHRGATSDRQRGSGAPCFTSVFPGSAQTTLGSITTAAVGVPCSASCMATSRFSLAVDPDRRRGDTRCFWTLVGFFVRVKPGRSFENLSFFTFIAIFSGGGGRKIKMSNVRLSNGSPTLERTEPRVSEHPKPSACRSLFGSVDHEELKRDLKGHLREMEDTASAKWGFDFASYSPLVNDRLDWKLVDCRDVPDFYQRPLRTRTREKGVCSAGNNNVDLNGNHSCVVVAAPGDDSSARSDGQKECTGLRKRPACHGTETWHRLTSMFLHRLHACVKREARLGLECPSLWWHPPPHPALKCAVTKYSKDATNLNFLHDREKK